VIVDIKKAQLSADNQQGFDKLRLIMKNFFVISVLGPTQPALMDKIFKAIHECGCNVEDGRMSRLGSELALFVMVSGPWDAISRIEDLIPKLEKKLNISIQSRRTKPHSSESSTMPYAVEVVSVNRAGLVYDIADFFSRRDIGIEDMFSDSYVASHTGTAMFLLQLTISIPTEISIATLRGEFMEFCDQLNIDSIMEPVK